MIPSIYLQMNPYSLFLRDGKLMAAVLPEKPDYADTKYKQYANPYAQYELEESRYKEAHAKALSEALEVVNPEVVTNSQMIDIRNVPVYFIWPGEVEKEFEPTPNDPHSYGKDVIRLLPVQPEKVESVNLESLIKAMFPEEKLAIDFATWYSGMERSKVLKAYELYKKESLKLNTQEKV